MKQYIASYQDDKEKCWDLTIEAGSYGEARKTARRMQKETGRLWSLRMKRKD